MQTAECCARQTDRQTADSRHTDWTDRPDRDSREPTEGVTGAVREGGMQWCSLLTIQLETTHNIFSLQFTNS